MPTRRRPRSVTSLLERFRGCFTAPTVEVFCALAGLQATPFALHQASLYGKPRTLAMAHFTRRRLNCETPARVGGVQTLA